MAIGNARAQPNLIIREYAENMGWLALVQRLRWLRTVFDYVPVVRIRTVDIQYVAERPPVP